METCYSERQIKRFWEEDEKLLTELRTEWSSAYLDSQDTYLTNIQNTDTNFRYILLIMHACMMFKINYLLNNY